MRSPSETARRIAEQIEANGPIADESLRILGVHPDDLARRKRRNIAAAVLVGATICAGLWFVI